MSLRVIQWATGSVGVAAIKGVLEHPELELVGCWVHSEAKNGKDVGEIIGTSPLGVIATNSIDDVLALDADAVIYAPLMPNVEEVAALLRSGKNVVTPLGWFYPSEKEAAPLEVAAQAGNATLHGAGIGPGAATELFPLLLSVMSTGVTFVRAEEFSDLRTYGAPDVLRYVMGFGGTPDSALTGPMQKLLDGGFIQSVRLCVDRLGFAADPEDPLVAGGGRRDRADRLADRGDRARAGRRAPLPLGGAGRRHGGRRDHRELADGGGKPRSALVFRARGERYEIEVRGNPDTFVTVKGWQPESVAAGLKSNPGIVATAAHCVNAIPATCRRPGGHPKLLRSAAHHRPGRARAWLTGPPTSSKDVTAACAHSIPSAGIPTRGDSHCRRGLSSSSNHELPVAVEDAFTKTFPIPLPGSVRAGTGRSRRSRGVRDQTGGWDAAGQTRTVRVGRWRQHARGADQR